MGFAAFVVCAIITAEVPFWVFPRVELVVAIASFFSCFKLSPRSLGPAVARGSSTLPEADPGGCGGLRACARGSLDGTLDLAFECAAALALLLSLAQRFDICFSFAGMSLGDLECAQPS